MKLYLVKRTDHTDYDEYDAIVVRAESKERAAEIAVARTGPTTFDAEYPDMRADNIEVTRIRESGDEEVILSSYNAG